MFEPCWTFLLILFGMFWEVARRWLAISVRFLGSPIVDDGCACIIFLIFLSYFVIFHEDVFGLWLFTWKNQSTLILAIHPPFRHLSTSLDKCFLQLGEIGIKNLRLLVGSHPELKVWECRNWLAALDLELGRYAAAWTQYAITALTKACAKILIYPYLPTWQIFTDPIQTYSDHSGKDCLVNVYLATMVFGAEPAWLKILKHKIA